MKSINKIIFLLLMSASLIACSKKPAIENTSTVEMSGEFFVESFRDGSHEYDFEKIMTYNTSDPSSSQIWLDDLKHTWWFKGKFDIDYATLSFKPKTAIPNLHATGETIDVLEGKIIPGAGHSKTGVAVDSIYLKATFSDDPGHTWEFKGHGRTGFFEDEY